MADYSRDPLHPDDDVCNETLLDSGVVCGLRPEHVGKHEAEADVLRRMARKYLDAFEQADSELRAQLRPDPPQ